MKTLFLAIPALFIACTSQDPPLKPAPSSLDESWGIWRSLENRHGGTYTYTTRYHSVFGFWTEHRYSIVKGSMKTILVSGGTQDSSNPASYQLDFDTLSHEQKTWYKTIDEHYRFCQDSVLTLDRSENDVFELQFLGNGILKNCTYYPHGCQDDCTVGPRIDTVIF